MVQGRLVAAEEDGLLEAGLGHKRFYAQGRAVEARMVARDVFAA